MHAAPETAPQPVVRSSWLRRLWRWPLALLTGIIRFLFVAWGAMALYYYSLPWYAGRIVVALAFFAFGIWALWRARRPRGYVAFGVVFVGLLVWWSTIKPSHTRNWRREVAQLPRATIDGDRVTITGVRNFTYRSRDDFDEHYETREVELSHLVAVDLYVSYWKIGPVGHTFVSFIFDNAPPVCISIETRPEVGEGFDPLASLFKQFELIYVVGDERDLVRLRIDHRNEETFMYRVRTTPEGLRMLFLTYIERINEIADRPEWYHLLSNSCTINIIRYANAAGREGGFHIGHWLNGWIDRYLYDSRSIDSTLPFAQLREQSHINQPVVEAGDAEDFSDRIRATLPTIPH